MARIEDDPRMPVLRWRSIGVAGCATALALAAGLPAVWWEPLHLDERVMLEFSPHDPITIVREVFVDRGGAPLQFLVEHVTLSWPGDLTGLRVPSLVFFLLALFCMGPVARGLTGPQEEWTATLLLAGAPLAVGLATFARMYALLLWLVLATAWLSLRAGRSGTRRDWLAAGALAGALVYAHPIAPLYALPAFACGLAVSELPVRDAVTQARTGVVTGVAVALPYVYALAVLRARYDIGEAQLLRTTAGRTVPEEALQAMTPLGVAGLIFFTALAVAGAVRLVRTKRRVGALLVLWVIVPIAFFTVVPAHTRFYGRYVLPALPAFLLLAAAGCVSLGRHPRIAVALVATLLALECAEDWSRLRTLSHLRLTSLPSPMRGQVLFSSTGLPRPDRPPELLDDLVALESPGALRVEELPGIEPRFDPEIVAKGIRSVRLFLGEGGDAMGLWLFRGTDRRVGAAAARLANDPDLIARRVGREFLVVSSRRAVSHRRLVELAKRLRITWGTTTPRDRWPRTIANIDRAALAGG
jgi:hypothetical protein